MSYSSAAECLAAASAMGMTGDDMNCNSYGSGPMFPPPPPAAGCFNADLSMPGTMSCMPWGSGADEYSVPRMTNAQTVKNTASLMQNAMAAMGQMQMTFYSGTTVDMWFSVWRTRNAGEYSAAVIGVFLFAIAHEILTAVRRRITPLMPRPDCRPLPQARMHESWVPAGMSRAWRRVIGTALYTVNVSCGQLLMLAVMTFNAGIVIAIVGGMGVGHATAAFALPRPVDEPEAAETDNSGQDAGDYKGGKLASWPPLFRARVSPMPVAAPGSISPPGGAVRSWSIGTALADCWTGGAPPPSPPAAAAPPPVSLPPADCGCGCGESPSVACRCAESRPSALVLPVGRGDVTVTVTQYTGRDADGA